MSKEFYVPMPTRKQELQNKEYDYRALGFILLHSNFTDYKAYGCSRNDLYGETYTYFNKLDFGGYGMQNNSTFSKKIAKMLKIDDSLINTEIRHNELIYKIDYAKEGKYFVTIPAPMLKELVICCNSNVIRTYCALCYLLKDGSKQMSNKFIREQVGIASDNTMDTILKSLIKLGFIKRELKPTTVAKPTKNMTTMATYIVKEYVYTLTTFEQWEQLTNKL